MALVWKSIPLANHPEKAISQQHFYRRNISYLPVDIIFGSIRHQPDYSRLRYYALKMQLPNRFLGSPKYPTASTGNSSENESAWAMVRVDKYISLGKGLVLPK
jgi:hypothetical protein